MLRRTLHKTMLLFAILILSGLVKLSYPLQQDKPLPAPAVWTHSDVYETQLVKDGATYLCTIISKGNELLVTIEVRKPIKEGLGSNDKREDMIVSGSIHKFKLNKSDESISDPIWLVYGETDKRQRYTNRAKVGPRTKTMLEPFNDVLPKLPAEIYRLLEKV